MLSDGNRIARKTTTKIYRDSEGRTRREQLSPTGEVQSVSISDPVAGSTYVAESGGQDRPSQRRDHDVADRIRDRECRVGQQRVPSRQ